jgi:hypothetical protein
MKNTTNKILLIVLFILLSAFALTKIFRTPARESNLDTEVFKIDTAEIAAIKFKSTGAATEMTLKENKDGWTIEQDKKTARASAMEVKNLLHTISTLRPERVVTRKAENWKNYAVHDSAALQLVAYNEKMDEIANWHIGKESAGSTFIRIGNDDEVYALEGSLRNPFEKKYDDWRDKTFLRVKKTSLNKITFSYPADSGFVLQKDGGVWQIGQSKADSLKVENYLRRLQSIDADSFAGDGPPSNDPLITLSIEGSGDPIFVKAWKGSEKEYILESSLQKGVYFVDSTVSKDLLASKKTFRVE